MATVQTRGFALSEKPRAPRIPANIGVVDVKDIYDQTRRGLESFEVARQARGNMALADAQVEAKTEQAPLSTRRVLAETVGVEEQTPLRTAILAEQASPERMAAERAALQLRGTVRPTSKAPAIQAAEALAAAEVRLAENPQDIAAIALVEALRGVTNKLGATAKADPTMPRQVAEITTAGRAEEGEANRGAQAKLAADKLAVEREKIASNERIRAAQDRNRLQLSEAKTATQRAQAGDKARFLVETGVERNKLFNRTVDRAISNLTDGRNARPEDSRLPGGNMLAATSRVVGAFIPGSESTDLESLLETMKSEAGFKELEAMRLAAPGGQGASGLGQVTERELSFLQSRVANLKNSQSDQQLYDNIVELRDAVNQAWKNVGEAYQRTYGTPMAAAPGQAASIPSLAGGATAIPTTAQRKRFTSAEEAQAAADRGEIGDNEVIVIGEETVRWVP